MSHRSKLAGFTSFAHVSPVVTNPRRNPRNKTIPEEVFGTMLRSRFVLANEPRQHAASARSEVRTPSPE